MAKKGLGLGLGALIRDNTQYNIQNKNQNDWHDSSLDKNEIVKEINIEQIISNKNQPRKQFDEQGLADLAQSIKSIGIIQPIVVNEIYNDQYEIIAGERRYRAAKIAGLKTVPCIFRAAKEEEKLKLALIENIQRQDLNPIEEAFAYKELLEKYKLTHEELSETIGKNRSTITNVLRLLQLKPEYQQLIIEKKISAGHARGILMVESEAEKEQLVSLIVTSGLSVREVEKQAKLINENGKANLKSAISDPKGEIKPLIKNNDKNNLNINTVQDDLIRYFGTKVKIKGTENKGSIEIAYYSLDDFNRIYELLKQS